MRCRRFKRCPRPKQKSLRSGSSGALPVLAETKGGSFITSSLYFQDISRRTK